MPRSDQLNDMNQTKEIAMNPPNAIKPNSCANTKIAFHPLVLTTWSLFMYSAFMKALKFKISYFDFLELADITIARANIKINESMMIPAIETWMYSLLANIAVDVINFKKARTITAAAASMLKAHTKIE
jgi:hypothetical protein